MSKHEAAYDQISVKSVITGSVPSKNNLSGSKNPLKWLGKKV